MVECSEQNQSISQMTSHRPYVMIHCDTQHGLSETNYRDYVSLCKKLDSAGARGRKIHIGMTSHGRPGDVFVPRHDLEVRHALERAGVKYEMVRMKVEGDPDPQKFRRLFNDAVLGKAVTTSQPALQRVQPPPVETLKIEAPTEERHGYCDVDIEAKHAADLEKVRRAYQRYVERRDVGTPKADESAAKRLVFGVWTLLIVTHFLAGALGYLLGINQ